MRPEYLDRARRMLATDMAEALETAGLDEPTRDAIAAAALELLDRVIFLVDVGDWDRQTRRVVAEFALVRLLPEVLQRFAPALARDVDDAERLHRVFETRRISAALHRITAPS